MRGRTVLVTGGARRVGAAIVRQLARAEARVVIHFSTSEGEAKALAAIIGERAIALGADLRRADGARGLLRQAVAAGFEPDAIVHAAASFERAPGLSMEADAWDDVFALNLRAFYLLAQALKEGRGKRGGDLVAIADSGALELWPSYLAHCVSKSALLDLTRILAKSMAPAFRVNAVIPGPVLPPEDATRAEREGMRRRTLLGRLGRPDDVARAVEFVLGSDFMTGATLEVTGGAELWRGSLPPLPSARKGSTR